MGGAFARVRLTLVPSRLRKGLFSRHVQMILMAMEIINGLSLRRAIRMAMGNVLRALIVMLRCMSVDGIMSLRRNKPC